MKKSSLLIRFLALTVVAIAGGCSCASIASDDSLISMFDSSTTECNLPTNFLTFAGGGSPRNNEIALEKNALYFQRTLQELGQNVSEANIFFANGNSGEATVRYIDEQGQQQFKVPQIPHLRGASTLGNFQYWMQQEGDRANKQPLFFYFTGHGLPDEILLWGGYNLTLKNFSQQLDRLPVNTPVTTVMAQCFAGSFADFIYQDGDRTKPLSPQTRCGFFATIRTRPSVGCTPEVDESDYKDYSSSFFAGLSGRSRTGEPVPSADYNQDGIVSYNEAHAFSKVDMQTMDMPISTLETWLQEQMTTKEQSQVLSQTIENTLITARPEQAYVIQTISQRFNFNLQQSYRKNIRRVPQSLRDNDKITIAYLMRLRMELLNIAQEKKVRESDNETAIAILDRLLHCEQSSW
ncbi:MULTISPECIES: Caspase domain-containing protein [Spirulina sp. CCY15215]|uniref:Caspase domain-containing protein n=1 Tax=Spirulina sp. CCY15215 TaxID=2767591 RepID=UPI001950A5CC|nr:Caspase domain-containing protein [Spirulina major]